ncbi:MAG: class IV adenylate cyclase [archaeon]|nr:class IV adenylate cyclase [archaeon]
MKEIEVKILEVDTAEIERKLLQLGAEKTFSGKIEATLFDHPELKLRDNDKVLRVRTVGDKVELCFKGKKEGKQFKIREEIEVETSNVSDTLQILRSLGFVETFTNNKERISYKLGNTKIEFDTIAGIPTFLEIEGVTEQDVMDCVDKLGYSMDETTIISANELMERYKS